jgi:hypothetical protein
VNPSRCLANTTSTINNVEVCTHTKECRRLALQRRRLISIRDAYKYLCNPNSSTPRKLKVLRQEITNSVETFARNTDVDNQQELETLELLTTHRKNPIYIHLKLTKAADDYHQVVNKLEERPISFIKSEARVKPSGKRSQNIISKRSQGPGAQPLKALQRPEDGPEGGGKNGTYTTNEKETDAIAREAWSEVYEGNSSNAQEVTQNFLTKCS